MGNVSPRTEWQNPNVPNPELDGLPIYFTMEENLGMMNSRDPVIRSLSQKMFKRAFYHDDDWKPFTAALVDLPRLRSNGEMEAANQVVSVLKRRFLQWNGQIVLDFTNAKAIDTNQALHEYATIKTAVELFHDGVRRKRDDVEEEEEEDEEDAEIESLGSIVVRSEYYGFDSDRLQFPFRHESIETTGCKFVAFITPKETFYPGFTWNRRPPIPNHHDYVITIAMKNPIPGFQQQPNHYRSHTDCIKKSTVYSEFISPIVQKVIFMGMRDVQRNHSATRPITLEIDVTIPKFTREGDDEWSLNTHIPLSNCGMSIEKVIVRSARRHASERNVGTETLLNLIEDVEFEDENEDGNASE